MKVSAPFHLEEKEKELLESITRPPCFGDSQKLLDGLDICQGCYFYHKCVDECLNKTIEILKSFEKKDLSNEKGIQRSL